MACEFCSHGFNGKELINHWHDDPLDGRLDVSVTVANNLLVAETDYGLQTRKINFCPMCGERLTKKS